jgi:hypothetical protein
MDGVLDRGGQQGSSTRGARALGDLVRYAVTPLLDVALTLYLWTQLSRADVRDRAGMGRSRLPLPALLTRLFRRKPPAMHTGEAPDPVSAR